MPDRRAGRDPPAGRQRHVALPRRPRGHRRGAVARRLAAHRRPRRRRRGGLPAHRRPVEGHVHRRRLQRLPGRDRERPPAPPRHPPGRGDRRPRRAPRRGRHGLRRAPPRATTHRRRRSSRGAASRWPTTRCRGRSSSSTRCRSTPPARSSRTSCGRGWSRARDRPPPGARSLRRPAGRRARRLGRRPGHRRAARRLGRRRHQGRAADRRPDAQRVRLARHRRRHAQPGLRPRQPGQAQRRPRPARPTTGKADLERLLASADVFISNLRPDALDKLGLEAEATVARHPHLVYCSVSGYGLKGDERDRPTYDIGAFWARSGLSRQMADGDGNPLNARGGIGDHITGLAALAGVLAAVMEQRHTGQGRRGRGVAAAHRRLRPRLGPRPPDDARQGRRRRAPAPQPGPADEPVPHVATAGGSSSPAWRRPATCPRCAGRSTGPTCSTTRGSPSAGRSARTAPR